MKNRLSFVTIALAATCLLAPPANADKFKGIGCGYSFNDVKAMFPGATFESLDSAWIKPGESALYGLTGGGINGSIIVKFVNLKKTYNDKAYEAKMSGNMEAAGFLEYLKNLPDTYLYVVERVRWVPQTPVKLPSLVGSFGKNFQTRTDDELQKRLFWPNRGIEAVLDEGKTKAKMLDYNFTAREQGEALELWKQKMARYYSEYTAGLSQTTEELSSEDGSDETYNASVKANLHQLQMALEQYGVDSGGEFPANSNAFMANVILKGDYIDGNTLPKCPWGTQSSMLEAGACGLAVPPNDPTPKGTVLGEGNEVDEIVTITDYGAIAYAVGGSANEMYILYGIGIKDGKAIITSVVKNY